MHILKKIFGGICCVVFFLHLLLFSYIIIIIVIIILFYPLYFQQQRNKMCPSGIHADKMKAMLLFSGEVVSYSFSTSWTVAHQAPPSMKFPRQEYWSGCHFLLQGIFLTPGLNPHPLDWQADSLPLSHPGNLKAILQTFRCPLGIPISLWIFDIFHLNLQTFLRFPNSILWSNSLAFINQFAYFLASCCIQLMRTWESKRRVREISLY